LVLYFLWFGQMDNDMCPSLGTIQNGLAV
jgi:hypothetical protein